MDIVRESQTRFAADMETGVRFRRNGSTVGRSFEGHDNGGRSSWHLNRGPNAHGRRDQRLTTSTDGNIPESKDLINVVERHISGNGRV